MEFPVGQKGLAFCPVPGLNSSLTLLSIQSTLGSQLSKSGSLLEVMAHSPSYALQIGETRS